MAERGRIREPEEVGWLSLTPAESDPLLSALGSDGAWIAGPPTREQSAFGPFRPLLRHLFPLLDEHLPEAVERCAPELAALLPELSENRLAGRPRLADVMQLPLGLARMLPRESELMFRMAGRIAWLLQLLGRRLVQTTGAVPLLVLQRLDEADRPTLITVHQLCRRARLGDLRVLVVSAPMPEPDVPLDLCDGGYHRRALLRQVCARAGWRQPAGPPVAAVCAGGGLPPGEDEEAAAIRQAASGDPQRWRAAVALSMRWFNPDAVLDLAGAALGHATVPAAEVWQAAGIAHASIGNFVEAGRCFRSAVGHAGTANARARAAMFSALVAAKRMGALDSAAETVEQGLRALDGSDGPAADLERGWLLNLKALLAYRRGQHPEALRLTGTALELMRPYRDNEAIGLKTNLVANTSIVSETMRRPSQALKVWRLFLGVVGRSSDVFAKYYYFREAGLKAKAGHRDAIAGYATVYELAQRLGDTVAAVAAARAASRLADDAGDADAARRWAEHLPGLADELGDVAGLPAAVQWLARCRGAVGDQHGSAEAAAREVQLRQRLGVPHDGDDTDPRPAMPPTMLRQPAELFLPA